MNIEVIKHDGTKELFCPDKLTKWASYASKKKGDWLTIAGKVYDLLPQTIKSEDIHRLMTQVCVDMGGIENSRVAARLELAKFRKNMERFIGVKSNQPFQEIYEAYVSKGIWNKEVLPSDFNKDWNEWYLEGVLHQKEYWSLVQWGDKYSIKVNGHPVETPHVALLASALAIHGDTQDAKEMYLELISGNLMTPTPALNGMRNGDFDTTSCSLFSSDDTKESIMVANYLTQAMTAKKAGIGNFYNVRSKGDSVRGGAIDHIGKLPIFREVEAGSKILLQLSRGGSVTTTVKCLDPEIVELLFTKSQRTTIDKRIDKIDYSFAVNDAFIDAVKKNKDWHLFSIIDAPEVHKVFSSDKETYNKAVEEALENGAKHSVLKARDLLTDHLIVRQETGRYYAINLSRVNQHTPFEDEIEQSNLCLTGDTLITIQYESGIVEVVTLKELVSIYHNNKKLKVLSFNERTKLAEFEDITAAALMNDSASVMVIRTYGSSDIRATPEHKIFTSNRGYVMTKDLTDGDILISSINGELKECRFLESFEISGSYEVYDITVNKNHNFFANGIVVHNCLEITQPTIPYVDMQDLIIGDENGDSKGEISFCSLGGVNYSKLVGASDEKIASIIKTGLKTIKQMMNKTPVLHETMSRKMQERSNAGLGMSGVADWLYQQGLDYDGSEESLNAVAWLAERHAYFSYKASIELVEEGYAEPVTKGIKKDWLPVDDAMFISGYELQYDWESLRGKPRAFSSHNCVQPFESSSVFFDGTNSIYPARNSVISKTSRAGTVVQYFKHFTDEFKSAWDIESRILSMYYSVIQDFTDLAISADQYFNPELFPEGKKPLSQAMKEWIYHFELGNKTLYYLNTKVQQGDIIFNNSIEPNNQVSDDELDFEDCDDCKM